MESVYFSGLAFCNATGRYICNMCKCMSLGCFCFSWNLEYDTLEVKCTLHALIGSSMLHDRIKRNRGSRGAPFGEDTSSPLRRYLKPLPKGGRGGRGGERGTEAPLRYLKGASKA